MILTSRKQQQEMTRQEASAKQERQCAHMTRRVFSPSVREHATAALPAPACTLPQPIHGDVSRRSAALAARRGRFCRRRRSRGRGTLAGWPVEMMIFFGHARDDTSRFRPMMRLRSPKQQQRCILISRMPRAARSHVTGWRFRGSRSRRRARRASGVRARRFPSPPRPLNRLQRQKPHMTRRAAMLVESGRLVCLYPAHAARDIEVIVSSMMMSRAGSRALIEAAAIPRRHEAYFFARAAISRRRSFLDTIPRFESASAELHLC